MIKFFLIVLISLPLLAAKQDGENDSGKVFPTHHEKDCREIKALDTTKMQYGARTSYLERCSKCLRSLLARELADKEKRERKRKARERRKADRDPPDGRPSRRGRG